MKILGVDYGKKRVGIALSDGEGSFAFPKMVLSESPHLAKEIGELAKREGVSTIVIGESRDYGGRENPLLKDIHLLERVLMDEGFTVVLEPEYGSSHEAARFQGKGPLHDASAAAIILQRYLDKQTR